jgi:hypothetical protein
MYRGVLVLVKSLKTLTVDKQSEVDYWCVARQKNKYWIGNQIEDNSPVIKNKQQGRWKKRADVHNLKGEPAGKQVDKQQLETD